MTPLFPAQRAAEEFDQVLSGTADDAVAARYAELLEAVGQLRALPEVTPREEFVDDLRSRLLTAAETDLVVAPTPTLRAVPSLPEERTRRRSRRLGTIAASLVVVGGTAGMAAAASGALPGDTLYPIKRGIEQVTTAAHLSEAGQGQALLDQAATRLDEVRALQAQGSADPDLVSETMDAFRTAADSGSEKLFASYQATGDRSDITTVRDFAAAQMADVAAMSASADTATNDLLVDAADTLADIDEQARGLCASCDPSKPVTPPGALSAGAGAATMANLIARPVSQVRTDVQTIAAARAARIKALRATAEKQADSIPQLPGSDGGTTYVFAGTSGKPGDPLTSTITSDGKLLPSVSSGAAVTGLVSGLTEPLDSATNGATQVVTQPVGDAVKKVGDTVGDITGSVSP